MIPFPGGALGFDAAIFKVGNDSSFEYFFM